MSYVWGARLVVPLSAALLAARAGNGVGLDANGQPLGSASAAPPPLTADFHSIQDNVFTPVCVRCHSGAGAPQGLQLDAAHSYALLVGVPSTEDPGLLRVKAGVPDSSYLVLKLAGSPGIIGAQMPFGGPPRRRPPSTSSASGSLTAPRTARWRATTRRLSPSQRLRLRISRGSRGRWCRSWWPSITRWTPR